MGLDIVVHVSPKEVLDYMEETEIKLFSLAKKLIEALPQTAPYDKTHIHTQPGSYSGLHRLRKDFIDWEGLEPEPGIMDENKGIPESHQPYHLLNHDDSGGWYLPDEFEIPIWTPRSNNSFFLSIGSSIKLLHELEDLHPYLKNAAYEWEALYIPAVASVATNQPIRFC